MKLNPLPNINRRQIKFCWIVDKEKNIKKWITFTVKDNEQLEYMYKKLLPDNCYQSITTYLNPAKIENPTYLAQKLILNSDIFLEVDDSETGFHYESYKDIKFAIEYMIDNSYKLIKIADSGGGFHAFFKSKVKLNPNARLRESQFKEEKKQIVEKLINLGVRLCKYTCLDILRVARIPNSYNGNREVYSREYSLKKFYALESSLKKNNDRNRFPSKIKSNGRTKVSPQLIFKALYISNKVFKNNYIPIMKFNRINDKNLSYLQRQYSLGNLYILKDLKYYYVVSLRVFDKRRCEKIMKASKCLNYKNFKNYNQVFFRTSKKLNYDKSLKKSFEVIEEKPCIVEILKYDSKGILSYRHADMLKSFGFDIDLDTSGIKKEVVESILTQKQ